MWLCQWLWGVGFVTVWWSLPFAASLSEAYTAYRLRLSQGTSPPADLYGDAGGGTPATYAWEVQELVFTSDLACESVLPTTGAAIASVGSVAAFPDLAFDADIGTAWRAGCVAGVDATQACRDSWLEGAWIGAQFDEPVVVQCIRLHHDGALSGLTLESWSTSQSSWIQLQAYGPVNGTVEVELSRLQGGTCSEGALSPPNASVPRAPLCEPYTQWRLLAPGEEIAWSVYEMELYSDALCHSRIEGGSPISSDGRLDVVTRFADGHVSTAWTAPCATDCAAGSLWVGFSFQAAEFASCVRIYQEHSAGSTRDAAFLLEAWNGDSWEQVLNASYDSVMTREWSFIPKRRGETGTLWRVVNDAEVQESWAIQELKFFADDLCTQRLTGGIPISSGDPHHQTLWASLAFDEDMSTAWVSDCGPCPPGGAHVGLSFGETRDVRCTVLTQALDSLYHPDSLRLESWSEPDAAWTAVASFSGLMGGTQQLTSMWGASRSRFVIANADVAAGGWRVAEIRLYSDQDCASRVNGFSYSSEGDPADASRAFDLNVNTFWHASCCRTGDSVDSCSCQKSQAWVGFILLENTTVQCVQMIQTGWVQPLGDMLFVTSKVALLEWDGVQFTTLYEWRHIPGDEWVELSVGRERTALGVNMGCRDIIDWERCNLSGWNCSYYRSNDMCNATFQSETDCGGIDMSLACRASCCLCGADQNQAHCGSAAIIEEQIPWGQIIMVTGLSFSAVVVLCCCCQSWKRRWCHERKGCRQCCKCLDVMARRSDEI